MSRTQTRTKMNLTHLREELSELKYRIETTRDTRRMDRNNIADTKLAIERTEEKVKGLKNNIFSMKKEIGDRGIHPEWYKVSAGAGTMEDLETSMKRDTVSLYNLQKDLEIYRELIADYEDREREATNTIQDLKDQCDDVLHQIATTVGLENLRNARTQLGRDMKKKYLQQKEEYDLQKQRYEECKHTFGFTPEDRKFIDHHTSMNEKYKAQWVKMSEQYEELSDMIKMLDPHDVDHGYDHDEE